MPCGLMTPPFPLAVITDEVSQDLERVIAFARDFQLGGVEVRSLFGRAFKDLTKADIRKIKTRFEETGLKVVGCAAPVFKCDIDRGTEIREHLDIFKRTIDIALEWNCDLIRVFTFLRKENPSATDNIRRAADHFPKLLEAIRGTHLRIGVENESTTIVGTGAESKAFFDHVQSPLVGLVWDPCNVMFIPGTGDPVNQDYPLIADRVIHFHVKDARREKGKAPGFCVELGKGEIDYRKQLEKLKAHGYRGRVSLETHWRAQALSAEVAHLPAGDAFSANAEPASRICMENLLKLLEGL